MDSGTYQNHRLNISTGLLTGFVEEGRPVLAIAGADCGYRKLQMII